MKEKNFKFRQSYAQAVYLMKDKEAGQFLKAICNYVFEKKEHQQNKKINAHFQLIKIALDEEKRDVENGKLGGLKRAQSLKQQQEETGIIIEMSYPVAEMQQNLFQENEHKKSTKSVAKKSKK